MFFAYTTIYHHDHKLSFLTAATPVYTWLIQIHQHEQVSPIKKKQQLENTQGWKGDGREVEGRWWYKTLVQSLSVDT